MQILFSTLPASGHFHPLVPLAKALQQAGHQVTFAMAESYRQPVEDAGFRFLLAGFEFPAGMNVAEIQKRQREMMRGQAAPDPSAMREMMLKSPFGRMLMGEEAHRRAKELLAAIERTPPDLVVSNPVELTSCMVAERLGLPYATVQVGAGSCSGCSRSAEARSSGSISSARRSDFLPTPSSRRRGATSTSHSRRAASSPTCRPRPTISTSRRSISLATRRCPNGSRASIGRSSTRASEPSSTSSSTTCGP